MAAATQPAAPAQRKLNENKPGEPAFQMKIEPESVITFRAEASKQITSEAVTQEVRITNTTKSRQTFKVKCTNNEIFRVRPPIGFVKPDETVVLKFVFQSKLVPENNKHFFAIYHFKTDDISTPARQLWTGAVRPEGVKRILAVFENSDGTQVTPENGTPAPAK